ncbi:MAG: DUF2490 domain-containing protein [Candidatus Margulisiibacteriota bacterium]
MIKRIYLALFFIALALPQAVFADTEFWSLTTFQLPFRENVKLNVIPELRFRNGVGEFYYFRTYFGPTLLLSKSFDLNLYYALNYAKKGADWTPSSLVCLDGIYKIDFPWFNFNNRGRFEYDISPDVLKYRNLFQFKKDAWILSDELFYNIKFGFFDEGRSLIAYTAKGPGNIDLIIGYLLRRQKQSATADWTRTNVINLGIKVNL